VLVNPRSDVDLRRIINTPPRGIGDTTVDRLAAFATQIGVPMHEALGRIEEAADLGSGPKKKLVAVRELLASLRAEVSVLSPTELLTLVLERTGYRESLAQEDSPTAEARLENLEELTSSIGDYEAEAFAAGEPPTLEGFLERITLQAEVDTMKEAPRVTLMTVHGAKGLEFEVVVLTGMEEEMFPYRGMEPGGEQEMEEERRLAYVAITRARTRLVMTHTDTRQIFGTTRWGKPSRFLGDLPKDVVEHLATRARGAGPERFIDRGGDDVWTRRAATMGGFRHPQSRPPVPPSRELTPGERFVDTEFFADEVADESSSGALRRGSRVTHERFGEGLVRRVENAAEPAVVAFFPGWGEKKILARYLKVAGT
jgi:DNA helicase-2/ATP-dependent DNA helicase PcrA